MKSYTIRKEWYEEIKNEVANADPYYYIENGTEYVEVDLDEEEFYRVSKELGWM
jgi:hypothetical protein